MSVRGRTDTRHHQVARHADEAGCYTELASDWADDPWLRFPRAFARDRRLSWDARGVALWMASHDQAFRFSPDYIVRSGPAGRDKIRRIMRELEQAGYLTRHRPRHADGTLSATIYRLHPTPQQPQKPRSEPAPENPSVAPEPQKPRSEPAPENPAPANPAPVNPSLDPLYRESTGEVEPPPPTSSPDRPAATARQRRGGGGTKPKTTTTDEDQVPPQVAAACVGGTRTQPEERQVLPLDVTIVLGPLLASLPAPTGKLRERLAAGLTRAMAAGWTVDQLHGELTRDSQNLRYPPAAWPTRLAALGTPPPVTKTTPRLRCEVHGEELRPIERPGDLPPYRGCPSCPPPPAPDAETPQVCQFPDCDRPTADGWAYCEDPDHTARHAWRARQTTNGPDSPVDDQKRIEEYASAPVAS